MTTPEVSARLDSIRQMLETVDHERAHGIDFPTLPAGWTLVHAPASAWPWTARRGPFELHADTADELAAQAAATEATYGRYWDAGWLVSTDGDGRWWGFRDGVSYGPRPSLEALERTMRAISGLPR